MAVSWRDPITIELGSNVIGYYTEKKTFFGSEPEQAGILVQQTSTLRENLAVSGVYLPGICYVDASDLNPNQFRINMGMLCGIYNLNPPRQTVLTVLEQWVIDYQVASVPSAETVDQLINNGVTLLEQESYNQAFDMFRKAFYWGLIVEGDTTESILASVLDIGYIHVLNNRADVAEACGSILQELVDAPTFSAPTLKYQSHMFYADVLWMNQHYDSALQTYRAAAQDVLTYPKSELRQFALWQFICACFQLDLETHKLCIDALSDLMRLVASDNRYTKSDLNNISTMLVAAQNKKVEELEREKARLVARCSMLENQLRNQRSLHSKIGMAFKWVGHLVLTFAATRPRSVNNQYNNNQYIEMVEHMATVLIGNASNTQIQLPV